ncbi:hypothetical protein ml_436 [Mollivirus sibericum]|uniref:hypothetical protein n=1 Tax=Mollivirus sibericum TaxID=1678078 RepID=UPI0006B2E7DF|nr:hypothetical protein ml_436 [Mollivirus sibericum]ALD62238.1 hypothetical protein ml_436 [Mollivirus sibericum]
MSSSSAAATALTPQAAPSMLPAYSQSRGLRSTTIASTTLIPPQSQQQQQQSLQEQERMRQGVTMPPVVRREVASVSSSAPVVSAAPVAVASASARPPTAVQHADGRISVHDPQNRTVVCPAAATGQVSMQDKHGNVITTDAATAAELAERQKRHHGLGWMWYVVAVIAGLALGALIYYMWRAYQRRRLEQRVGNVARNVVDNVASAIANNRQAVAPAAAATAVAAAASRRPVQPASQRPLQPQPQAQPQHQAQAQGQGQGQESAPDGSWSWGRPADVARHNAQGKAVLVVHSMSQCAPSAHAVSVAKSAAPYLAPAVPVVLVDMRHVAPEERMDPYPKIYVSWPNGSRTAYVPSEARWGAYELVRFVNNNKSAVMWQAPLSGNAPQPAAAAAGEYDFERHHPFIAAAPGNDRDINSCFTTPIPDHAYQNYWNSLSQSGPGNANLVMS